MQGIFPSFFTICYQDVQSLTKVNTPIRNFYIEEIIPHLHLIVTVEFRSNQNNYNF